MKKTIAMILALVMVFALTCTGMAFADDNLGAERFCDGDWPAHREAEQE